MARVKTTSKNTVRCIRNSKVVKLSDCKHLNISIGLSDKPYCLDCLKDLEWIDLKKVKEK